MKKPILPKLHFTMRSFTIASAFLFGTSLAQTFSDCNPLYTTCPPDNGLKASTYSVDFAAGKSDDWAMTNGDADYNDQGAAFTITGAGQSPTMQSNFHIFFGTITAMVKAAKGVGVVSAFILESDVLDEIDFEWLGGDVAQVQTNYFGKGNTTSYDRATYVEVGDTQDTWHNYTIDWNAEQTTWYVDGEAVRTLNYEDAVGGENYPQTPMRIKMGIWSASGTSPGTVLWAGGETDFSQAPFTMQVKSVTIVNANPASSYTYGDNSGSWQSIKSS